MVAAGTTFTVVSGETGQPLAGARFIVAGRRELLTNSAGVVALDQDSEPGTSLDVIADGFLKRQTILGRDVRDLPLWPTASPTGLDEAYTRRIVYTSASDNESEKALTRPPAGASVAVVPNATIQSIPVYMSAMQDVVARMTAATGLNYTLVNEEPSSGLTVTIAVPATREENPAECNSYGVAFTSGWGSGDVYLCWGAFHPDADYWSYLEEDGIGHYGYFAHTALHELGHTFGLQHCDSGTSQGDDVMCKIGPDLCEFNARERLVIDLMLMRPPGNQFPDIDRGVIFATNKPQVYID